MGHMPPELQPIDLDSRPDEVIEFGSDAPEPRRRWNPAGLGRSLATDRRVVPLTAVLAAVAVLASLVSEWQVTTVDAKVFGGPAGTHPVSTNIADIGALGEGYVVGLFPLVVAVVLALFGPAAGRRWARLGGMSVGGTLLGLLFAVTTSLGNESRVIPDLYLLQLDKDDVEFTYGRGLWCAVAGVLLAMLALYLADRHRPAASPATAAAPDPVEEEIAAWGWRRPPAPRDEVVPDQPLELTVAPAKPFTSFGDDRDKPTEP